MIQPTFPTRTQNNDSLDPKKGPDAFAPGPSIPLLRRRRVHALGELHPQLEVQVLQLALDLAERGAAEGAELEEVAVGLADQLGHRLDPGRLEAVARTHRQLHLADG